MKVVQHSETWVPDDEIGNRILPYLRTYEADGSDLYIDDTHRSLASSPVEDGILINLGIPGWLRIEDALKLYELAYYSAGDIVELGFFQGLSTSILASAIRDSQDKQRVVSTIDLNPELLEGAQRHIDERGLHEYVRFTSGDAVEFAKQFIAAGRRFNFAFVDHSHAYKDMLVICDYLPALINPGGFCLFHDYNDIRNRDLNDADYGVSRAVREKFRPEDFEFYGIFGCTGLYRRV
jgi:predicted O-methyltransferase YrrM